MRIYAGENGQAVVAVAEHLGRQGTGPDTSDTVVV